MILTKEVTVKWCPTNTRHYKSLGYIYEYKGEFKIPIKHLTTNSNVKIDVKCDICGDIKTDLTYQSYNKNFSKYGIYTCHKCSYIKTRKLV